MPNECASIGDSPGRTDHLYNAGTAATNSDQYERNMEPRRSGWLDEAGISDRNAKLPEEPSKVPVVPLRDDESSFGEFSDRHSAEREMNACARERTD